MLSLSGHLGDKVSALVDGQLGPAEEERAWAHVLACPGCRRLVEHETWTKQALGAWATPQRAAAVPSPPAGLLSAPGPWADWSGVDREQRRPRRRRTVAVVGGGAVAASVIGLMAVTGTPGLRGDVPVRPSPASIRGDLAQRGGGVVGTPTGAERTATTAWTRRSR